MQVTLGKRTYYFYIEERLSFLAPEPFNFYITPCLGLFISCFVLEHLTAQLLEAGLYFDVGIARILHTLGHYVAHFIVLDGSQAAKLAVEGVLDAESRTARALGINARDRPPYRRQTASVNSPLLRSV